MLLETLDSVMRALGWGVGGGILVNQLDELHVDAQYFLRGLHRRRARAITPQDLRATDKRIAVLVPAWKEAEVIEQMLDHNLRTLDYDLANVHFFCGTYPNDPDTQFKVDAVARRAPNVHKVVVEHDGPTSKADCLNHVYRGILEEERRSGERFDIFLMHDAEDVIHPSSLRLYAHLIPRHEFVQTPVFSLPVPLTKLVAGTYIDEFAEHHLKDMLVREAIGGLVPSAGVGSAFARDAFEAVATAHGDKPFNVESLTEDYEIGLKFRLAERRVHFACRALERPGAPAEYIATREYFPDAFGASIRQRSRWILGITMQTWAQIGWKGALPVLYCLWRDRKALFTNVLLTLAYLLLAYVAVREIAGTLTGHPWSVSAIAGPRSLLGLLLAMNLATAVWRAAMKGYFVARLNGLGHALLSAPRLVLANVISIVATTRAVNQYVRHRISGEPLRWLKTTHAFLAPGPLAAAQRLGEWLVERGLPQSRVDEALALQRTLPLPLGEILVLNGALGEAALNDALAQQHGVDVGAIDAAAIPVGLLQKIDEAEVESMGIVPLAREDGKVIVASAAPLPDRALERLRALFGADVLARPADAATVARTRARAYRRLLPELSPSGAGRARLGDVLLRREAIAPPSLAEALARQARTGEPLGEVLVSEGLASIGTVRAALSETGDAFDAVRSDEADLAAIARLGLGFCALYTLVPLARRSGPARVVAAPAAVHPLVRAQIEERLGEPVDPLLAPALSLRVALAVASGSLTRAGGVDDGELAVLRAELGDRIDLDAVARDARSAARSPIDQLEATGRVAPVRAASMRARALGVPLATEAHDPPGAVLPRALAEKHGIRLRALDDGAIVLAAPRPDAEIARAVTSLLPRCPIAWEVLAPHEENPNVSSVAS
jgi:adsorption protein B